MSSTWSRLALSVSFGASAVFFSASSAAAEPPEDADSKINYHDGFYLRIGTGFGAYFERTNSESTEIYDGRVRARARGFAVMSEFAMGGTPWEGVVIGGGVFGAEVYTSSVTFNKKAGTDGEPGPQTLPEELSLESRELLIIAPFIDRYFLPDVGVHAQFALGITQQIGFSVNTGEVGGSGYTPIGPGMMLGFGYELWIAEQWSLGVLARFMMSVMFGKDEQGVNWVHYVTTNPAFLMTVTYH